MKEEKAAGRRLSCTEIAAFQDRILEHYRLHGRDLPWRKTDNPYHVFISEMMLQQTQVDRVVRKYGEFLAAFPDFTSLAKVSLREIMAVWQGMGYNRRALALSRTAQKIVADYGGILPETSEELAGFPGIGKATAASMIVFAFNKPAVFIETNIRRVFIHEWFGGRGEIRDKEIIPLVEETLYRPDPRTWYHALMDYGAMLGRTSGNDNVRSVHYRKQPSFKDSDRKIRGMILGLLLRNPALSPEEIGKEVYGDGERTRRILSSLEQEGLVREKKGRYSIP